VRNNIGVEESAEVILFWMLDVGLLAIHPKIGAFCSALTHPTAKFIAI
jgi:hypothetical protein